LYSSRNNLLLLLSDNVIPSVLQHILYPNLFHIITSITDGKIKSLARVWTCFASHSQATKDDTFRSFSLFWYY